MWFRIIIPCLPFSIHLKCIYAYTYVLFGFMFWRSIQCDPMQYIDFEMKLSYNIFALKRNKTKRKRPNETTTAQSATKFSLYITSTITYINGIHVCVCICAWAKRMCFFIVILMVSEPSESMKLFIQPLCVFAGFFSFHMCVCSHLSIHSPCSFYIILITHQTEHKIKCIHDTFVRTYSPVTQPLTMRAQAYKRTLSSCVWDSTHKINTKYTRAHKHTHKYIRECMSCILSFNIVLCVLLLIFSFLLLIFITRSLHGAFVLLLSSVVECVCVFL